MKQKPDDKLQLHAHKSPV